MTSPRSTVPAALAIACALVLGLLALLSSTPPAARAWPGPRSGPAFVKPGGSGPLCTRASPCGSLQYAIDQAEPGNGDVIYVAKGTYTGTGEAVIVITKTVALYGGWNGVASGALVRDPAAYPTTLDGENARRVVLIETSAPTLEGFAIVRGNATGLTVHCPNAGGSPLGCGGGIMSYAASPMIAGNVISGNVAAATSVPTTSCGYGGGVAILYGSGAVLRDNLIQGNVAGDTRYGMGGGVQLLSTNARIEGNRILSNTAASMTGGAGWGGGIAGGPAGAAIVGNVIEGNRARASGGGSGGGLFQWQGSALYSGNRVRGNEGQDAVYLGFSGSRFEANLVLGNATASGIRVEYGGPPTLVLANNVVAASGSGVAVLATGSLGHGVTPTLVCNTLIGAGAARGVRMDPYGSVVMTDNIVAGFALGITATVPASSTVLVDHTLFWGNADDGLVGTNPVPGDPRSVHPPGGDYHIDRFSAALDAGVAAGVTTDMDGDGRFKGAGCHIGADENAYQHYWLPPVPSPGGAGGGRCSPGCSRAG